MISQTHIRIFVSTVICAACVYDKGFGSPSVEEGMQIGGNVPDICRLATPVVNGVGINANFQSTSDTNSQIEIIALAGKDDGVLKPASISLDFEGSCNFAHFVSLASSNGGLKNETVSGITSGFLSLAGYSATLIWSGQSENLNANTGSSGVSTDIPQIGANSGILSLVVQIAGGGNPLVSGTYSDVLTIEFGGTL